MRKLILFAVAALALSGCVTPDAPPPPPPPVAETPTVPVPAQPPADSCKAGDHQYLVGRNRTQIPVPADPSKVRVACASCPVTMDYRPDRLNIFYDSETGLVKEVKCG